MHPVRRLKDWRQSRRVRRIIQQKMDLPYPTPAEIHRQAEALPKGVKKAHKLEVRRGYRKRWSPLPTEQRQILAEMVAGRVFAEREAERAEDERYAVGSKRASE